MFNIVDRNKVLTVPYFFMKKYQARNPVVEFLKSIDGRPTREPEKGELVLDSSLKKAIATIPKVGWLTLFRAGTGEAKELDKKLADYIVEQGYEIIPVGGDRGELSEDAYINERVFYEIGLQAANVVQLGPGRVVAYAHNHYTNTELQRRGVEVFTMEGKYLADMWGGPHCMSMPLSRERP